MKKKQDIGIGTTFRSQHADGNPLWRVVKARGSGTWDCVVDETEFDWAGTRKVFGTEEISRSLASDAMWKDLQGRTEDFWTSVRPGQTLHYHDSFGRYVRGVVVDGKNREGRNALVMKPTALVGKWDRVMDLPHWSDAGFFREGGYHAKRIAEGGETFQPNPSSIWESSEFAHPRGEAAEIDPTKLPELDITPPPPTDEQVEAARLLAIVNEMQAALSSDFGSVKDFAEEYRRQIREVGRIFEESGFASGMDVEEDSRFRP